jgi:hypothetical protein
MAKNGVVFFESSRLVNNRDVNKIKRIYTVKIPFEAPLGEINKAIAHCLRILKRNYSKHVQKTAKLTVKGEVEVTFEEKYYYP